LADDDGGMGKCPKMERELFGRAGNVRKGRECPGRPGVLTLNITLTDPQSGELSENWHKLIFVKALSILYTITVDRFIL